MRDATGEEARVVVHNRYLEEAVEDKLLQPDTLVGCRVNWHPRWNLFSVRSSPMFRPFRLGRPDRPEFLGHEEPQR